MLFYLQSLQMANDAVYFDTIHNYTIIPTFSGSYRNLKLGTSQISDSNVLLLVIFIYIGQYSAKSHQQARATGLKGFVAVSSTFSQNYPTTLAGAWATI
jgi:hypothetical protein